jgi:predicted membrane-bound spermidine synthase
MARSRRAREAAASEQLDGLTQPRWGWIAAGLACTTCATLLLEIVITRIFSVILIYHFAFMAISLALFGLGLAGIFVYLYPELFSRRRLSATTAVLALLFAAACVGALVLFHAFIEASSEWPLPFTSVMGIFLIMAVPFFASGLTVAVPISRCSERIGSLYAADLAGAAVGAALAIPVLGWLGGPMAVLFCGLLGCASALCFSVAASRRSTLLGAGGGAAICVALLLVGSASELFSLRHSRFGREQHLLFQQWNSFSRISVWGPYPHGSRWRLGRGAPVPGAIPGTRQLQATHLSVVIDGGAKTPMARFDGRFEPLEYFRYDVTSLGYQVRRPSSALIIGSGGGRDILTARLLGVDRIRAVEINPLIVDISRRHFRDFSGSPYDLPGVETTLSDGRSFAAESTERFDLVQLSAVDTFAASGGGALALVEHSLYTEEAFQDYFDRLSDDGIVSMTHKWGVAFPDRALRAVDLVRRAWQSRGVADPSRHIVVIGRQVSWGTMLASRRPFTPDEIARIQRLVERLGFGVLYAPGDPGSLEAIARLLGPDPDGLLASYPKNVSATTDDRPFFFFFERPAGFLQRGLVEVGRAPRLGEGTTSEGAAPTLLVRMLLWMIGLNALLIFALPLALGRMRLAETRGAGRSLLYFACIGLGFITVEIPLIQRYTLLLGQPIYAFAVILGCVLVASGAGSWISGRFPDDTIVSRGRLVIALLIAGAVLHALAGSALIHAGLRFGLPARLGLTVATIAPLGLVMGMPLPLGIRMLEARAPSAIAWAWGINGSLSVVGTILAMMISVTSGMTWTILFGAAAYGVALVAAGGGRAESPAEPA